MTSTDDSRPIGATPITDAAAATAPTSPTSDSGAYSASVSSNADLDNNDADDSAGVQSADAPESFNSEQDDEAAQAQTVSDDAIRGIAGRESAHESEHGGTTNPAQINADDTQDVVDHMNQMERSGRIDMDAYRGERSDDDEPDTMGEAALEPDDIDSHGNRPRDTY